MFNNSFGSPFGAGTGGFGTTSTFGQTTGFGTTPATGSASLIRPATFIAPPTGITSNTNPYGRTSASLIRPATFTAAPTEITTKTNPFGRTSASLIRPATFTAAPTGTTTMMDYECKSSEELCSEYYQAKWKGPQNTTMMDYECKSSEELRFEYYQANRKGPQNPVGAATGAGLFATASSSASTGLFGSTGANTSFSFGNTTTLGQQPTQTMGLFGATQPTQSGGLFGTTTSTNVGAGFGTGTGLFGQPNASQTSLFGNNQPKVTGTLGKGAFHNTAFNTSSTGMGFGEAQVPVALTAQQLVLQQHINTLAYSPYIDSPLFRNPISDRKKKEERLKPTICAAQTTVTQYKLTLRLATRARPRALNTGTAKKQQLDGLDDDEPSLSNGAFMPKKKLKKFTLKYSSSLYSVV